MADYSNLILAGAVAAVAGALGLAAAQTLPGSYVPIPESKQTTYGLVDMLGRFAFADAPIGTKQIRISVTIVKAEDGSYWTTAVWEPSPTVTADDPQQAVTPVPTPSIDDQPDVGGGE